jgi:small subunit ribosomal protein S1
VQVGDGIEGLVHISEMAVHHVDLPEQVVTPGEELWVKIIDIDLQRRRISLSIKQAAEGGEVSEEYREAFGEHAYDEEGNYIGFDYAEGEFTPETEAQAAWADFAEEIGTPVVVPDAATAENGAAENGAAEAAAPAEAALEGAPAEAAPAEAAPAEAAPAEGAAPGEAAPAGG